MPRILVSGSTGLLGQRLVADRRAAGDIVVPLVRPDTNRAAEPGSIPWDPRSGHLDPALVSGFDAVLHLAGEPVSPSGLIPARWSADKKRRILVSRVLGTRTLVTALAAAPRPPAVFLCASGINVYGNRGSALLSDAAPQPAGNGFLAEVCRAWEAACDPLRPLARVVSLRIGAVLSARGGILGTMLPIFRLGLGGPVAGGHAWLSWISLDDLAGAVAHTLASPTLAGPLNVVSPHPVTGRTFSAVLATALRRPAIVPVPGGLVRLLFGQFADETILSSVRAVPQRLLQDGFRFQQPELRQALAAAGLRP